MGSDMTRTSTSTYVPNLLVVGVDERRTADYAGRMWIQYQPEPIRFSSILEMVWKAEQFFDRIAFPQRATQQRTFLDAGRGQAQTATLQAPRGYNSAERAEKRIMKDIESNRGKKGTFIVQVKYRQNSTWQGEVTWAEQNRKVYFRSALELVQLMDQALQAEVSSEGRTASIPAEWEQQDTATDQPNGSQRPEAPSGRMSPEEDTGRPISSD